MRASLLFASALLLAAPALGQQPNHPWEADGALAERAMAEVQSKGILALEPHRDDLERSLGGAKRAAELAGAGEGDIRYVLSDGAADGLVEMTAATMTNKTSGKVVAVANPYPKIGFLLGSYYDEIGKPTEAVRVLEAGLAADSELGETRAELLVERGAALGGLKQWPASLASYEEGLKIDGLSKSVRAYMHRGRGFALVELGRLNEAEVAYKESLNLQPNNERALGELKYIDGLRKGGAPTDTSLSSVQPKAEPSH